MAKPETIVTIVGINQPGSATYYTSHEMTIMPTEKSMANLTVFLVPITIGIVLLSSFLSPSVSPISLNGDVMNTIEPSIIAAYITMVMELASEYN
jgi:hypothetical protein